MTAASSDGEFAPTPLHRALDQVTALKVQIQQLRRHHLAGDAVAPDHLQAIEGIVDALAATLLACRGQGDDR